MASDVAAQARQRSQQRAQQYAAKRAAEVADAAAQRAPVGKKASERTRIYNTSFPILYEQVAGQYYSEEYARLLVEGSA
jgi:hypothetical protein